MDYLQLTSSSELPDISALRPFKAVVIVEDAVSSDRQAAISRWLVESGCLYVMAWGIDCGEWESSVELANFEAFDFDEIPDDCVVMTTWHEGESLKDVFWFSKHSAMHPCRQLQSILLLHLSPTGREQEMSNEYLAA